MADEPADLGHPDQSGLPSEMLSHVTSAKNRTIRLQNGLPCPENVETEELKSAKLHVLREWLPDGAFTVPMDMQIKNLASSPEKPPAALEDWPALLHGCGNLSMPPRARWALRALREWLPGDLTVDKVDRRLRSIEAIKTSNEQLASAMRLKLRSEIIGAILAEGGAAIASLRNENITWFKSNSADNRRICLGVVSKRKSRRDQVVQKIWVDVTDAAEVMQARLRRIEEEEAMRC